jgi:DNA-binding HxlR family transcriptional regulator
VDRLQKQEALGIVAAQRDASDARRIRYRLTVKGLDLVPVLVEDDSLGARYEDTDAPPRIIRRMKEDRERFIAEVRERYSRREGK